MAAEKKRRTVRMDDLPAAERELAWEQSEGVTGGFDPQPDPPANRIGSPRINPIQVTLNPTQQ
jgi:hypothetical protein